MMVTSVNQVLYQPELILKQLEGIELASSYVYISGSLLEGFGNEKSDIDVYVICKEIPKKFPQNNVEESLLWEGQTLVHNVIQGGVRYDFEYWTWDCFNKSINNLQKIDFKTEEYIERISDAELDLLHRLKYAKPLINSKDFFNFHNMLQFDNLGYYQAVIASEIFTALVEDIQGALLSYDLGSAFFMVRRLVELATVSYLAIHGETNPNSKWLFRKMKRYEENTGDTQLLVKYLKYQTHPFEKATVEGYIKEAMKFAQSLNAKVQQALQEIQKA
ncbi:hypothetical protein D3C74_106750 [compost metagenome]